MSQCNSKKAGQKVLVSKKRAGNDAIKKNLRAKRETKIRCTRCKTREK